MSGTNSPVDPYAGMDPGVAAQMKLAQDNQNKMFESSIAINSTQSELQTWGNLGEEIAKAKPQV